MLKLNESINIPNFASAALISGVLLTGMEISNLRKAHAEVPIGNINPFDAETMKDTNIGATIQNYNGQQLKGLYFRANTQELGITNPSQTNINTSILLKDNNTQNLQISADIGSFSPYANVLINQGKPEFTLGVFAGVQTETKKINFVFEKDSEGNTLDRTGVGFKVLKNNR
jgi:hypothetical protein